ncbi:hypothetical protein HDU92_008444 [Lobulomyces angularis]|nr:hypothetical protein HDU92_008444 [Lobulomyces angularis]
MDIKSYIENNRINFNIWKSLDCNERKQILTSIVDGKLDISILENIAPTLRVCIEFPDNMIDTQISYMNIMKKTTKIRAYNKDTKQFQNPFTGRTYAKHKDTYIRLLNMSVIDIDGNVIVNEKDYYIKYNEYYKIDNLSLNMKNLSIKDMDYVVFDIETLGFYKNSALTVACCYDSLTNEMFVYKEDKIKDMFKLFENKLVVGYNIISFDYRILANYGFEKDKYKTLDLLTDIRKSNKKAIKLDVIAKNTISVGKDRFKDIYDKDVCIPIRLWEDNRIDDLIEYCSNDVILTKDLYLFGKKNKYVMSDKSKLTVNW